MSQKLFDLVKTMSKNEKGYFKKYAYLYSKSDNISIKLFDMIEEQKLFDEKDIKHVLFNDFQNSNYYNVSKNYLYNIILKSLRSFHSKKKISHRISAIFTNIEILFQKKLISHCVSELKKVKKLIIENEKFEKGSELFIWEKRLHVFKGFSSKYDELEQQYFQEKKNFEKKEQNFELFAHYQYQFFSVALKQRTRREKEDLEKLTELINKKDFNEENALSKRSLILFYNTKSKYFNLIKNNDQFYIYSLKFVEFLEANPFLFVENVDYLVSSLYNLLVACNSLKDREKFDFYYEKFVNIPKKYSKHCSKELEKLVSFFALNISTFFSIQMGDFEKAYMITKTKLPIQKREIKGVFKTVYFEFLYLSAYASFTLGKNEETQDLLKSIFDFPSKFFRQDIFLYAKLLDLLNHYDLENYKLVENLLDTTLNNISKFNRNFKSDQYFIKMLASLLKPTTTSQKHGVLIKYKKIFENIKNESSEDLFFENLDILRWITHKTNKI